MHNLGYPKEVRLKRKNPGHRQIEACLMTSQLGIIANRKFLFAFPANLSEDVGKSVSWTICWKITPTSLYKS